MPRFHCSGNFARGCGHNGGANEFERWTDAELFSCAGDDPEAFGELLERHGRAVHESCAQRTADLTEAEDLTSIVF
jgi:hypothetical protein